MEDDPFLMLAEMLSPPGAPAGLTLGKVISAPDADHPGTPLKIAAGGTVQEIEDLLKNSDLTSFSSGDLLLLLPIEDAQRYIIICKVVNA